MLRQPKASTQAGSLATDLGALIVFMFNLKGSATQPALDFCEMSQLPYWVDIDVAKQQLDVYIRPTGASVQRPNTEQGIAKLVEHFKSYSQS